MFLHAFNSGPIWQLQGSFIVISMRSSNAWYSSIYIIIYSSTSIIYRLIIDPHNEQFLVGVIAQSIEPCSGIAEVTVQILIQVCIFLAIVTTG